MNGFWKVAVTILEAGLMLSPVGEAAVSNGLFDAASPETSALVLYEYKGEKVYRYAVYDRTEIRAVLDELDAAEAVPVEKDAAEAELPMYGLEIGTADGLGIRAGWSNGYLYLRDGTVYEFNYDFDALLEEHSDGQKWEFEDAAVIPCAYYMAQDENGWKRELLTMAEDVWYDLLPAELLEQTADSLTIQLKNDSESEWMYGSDFNLDVKLGNMWYDLPSEPSRNWGFTGEGIVLLPGASETRTYFLDMYGDLPAGEYRLNVEGTDGVTISCNFMIEE